MSKRLKNRTKRNFPATARFGNVRGKTNSTRNVADFLQVSF